MCQVEQWITLNQKFLSQVVDPVMKSQLKHFKNSKVILKEIFFFTLIDFRLFSFS